MAVRTKNLNLIPLLQALLEEESVVAAARRMNLSQPAMSGALARLRDALNDPLLIRSGRSMHLTPRAQELRPSVNRLCDEIEKLFEPAVFDPSTADHQFVVATPDYLAYLISRELLPRLSREAPSVTLRLVDVPTDLPVWLRDADIDLAVCGNFGIWPELEYEPIFQDPMVAVTPVDHPLGRHEQVSIEQLQEFPWLAFRPGIERYKHQERTQTGIPSLDLLSQVSIVQTTDAVLLTLDTYCVTTAPKSLAEALGEKLPLKRIELINEESPIDTGMFWIEAHSKTPAMNWLRMIIRESLGTFSD